jgi:hypothetical protein
MFYINACGTTCFSCKVVHCLLLLLCKGISLMLQVKLSVPYFCFTCYVGEIVDLVNSYCVFSV